MTAVIRCQRCGRRYRGSGEWNVELKDGRAQFYLCPDCQTVEENTEAEVRMATLDYYTDALGGRAPGRRCDHRGAPSSTC